MDIPKDFVFIGTTDGLSGSGGDGKTHLLLSRHFLQNSRRSRTAEPLSDADSVRLKSSN
jgi:hypothetical protein